MITLGGRWKSFQKTNCAKIALKNNRIDRKYRKRQDNYNECNLLTVKEKQENKLIIRELKFILLSHYHGDDS